MPLTKSPARSLLLIALLCATTSSVGAQDVHANRAESVASRSGLAALTGGGFVARGATAIELSGLELVTAIGNVTLTVPTDVDESVVHPEHFWSLYEWCMRDISSPQSPNGLESATNVRGIDSESISAGSAAHHAANSLLQLSTDQQLKRRRTDRSSKVRPLSAGSRRAR